MLTVVVHLGIPHQFAGEAIERDEVGVVGDAEHQFAANGDDADAVRAGAGTFPCARSTACR